VPVMFINQLRQKIGVTFGNPLRTLRRRSAA
jgi:RecA/RadA recombinase